MSASVSIQAAITCGGRHDMPVRLIVPLGSKRRRQFHDYSTGYAEGKGWTIRWPDFDEAFMRALTNQPNLGASDNDWRCPECSKAGA